MRRMTAIKGFSLVELVLSLGLLAIVILAVSLLGLSIVRSSTESTDRVAAAVVAETLLDQAMKQAQNDAGFWTTATHSPYIAASATIGGQEYDYVISAETVTDSGGAPLGDALANNVLKRVTIDLTWFDTSSQERQGYGKLDYHLTKLVMEETL